MKKPKVNQWTPQTPEQVAQGRKVAEDYRREVQLRKEAERPWRRLLLQAGPPLRDIDLALDCPCGCHPRLDITTHDGGSTCRCQDTTEELKAARRQQAQEALRSLQSIWNTPESEELAQAEKEAVEAAAQRAGVQLKSWGGAAPFQMEGVVDGLSFYVRERHQSYRVHVAPPDRPLHFTEGEGRLGEGDVIIDDGEDVDLYEGETGHEAANAVLNVARVVRDYQRRAGCHHILTNEKGTIQFRFCPVCGIRAEEITGFQQ